MEGTNYFGVIDYIVVLITISLSMGIGIYYAYFQKSETKELLTGGKRMSPLPIGASIMVTYLSAIVVIGTPGEVFAYGIQIYMITLVDIVFLPLSGFIFIKFYYDMNLTSVYEYLERRFDSKIVRKMASFTFILQMLLWSGIALYAPAIALETALGLPVWLSIAGVGLLGTIYTSLGGIAAVVWTDCFQCLLIAVGMVAILIRGFVVAGGVGPAFQIAADRGRLNLFDFTFDIFMRHNFWNFVFGWGVVSIIQYGTHQPLVQRLASLPSYKHAFRAFMYSIPLKVVVRSLIVFTGVSVFAAYATCSPLLLGKIKKADAIITYFMVHELAFIPGLLGTFVSCIFSAVLSTISSTLNSLAAVTWEDFLSELPIFYTMGEKGKANTVRLVAFIYGVLAILLGFLSQHVKAIFQACLTSYGAASGALGGTFCGGMFISSFNKHGAMSGMMTSLFTMFFIGFKSILLQVENPRIDPILGTDLSGCLNGTDFSSAISDPALTLLNGHQEELEWPTKLYRLSYIFFPFAGALITLVVGMVVSILTGGVKARGKVPKEFLHSWVHFSSNSDGKKEEITMQDTH